MNYRRIESWAEAEKIIPVGGKCFLDPKGERWVERNDGDWALYAWDIPNAVPRHRLGSPFLESIGATPYEATTEAVPITPGEAAARMVDAIVEGRIPDLAIYEDGEWKRITSPSVWRCKTIANCRWGIPACPAKQKLTIEVDAGVEVPDEFYIPPDKWWMSIGDKHSIPATVIHREEK